MAVLQAASMTKREIALAVSERISITQLDAGRVVKNVLDAIKEILIEKNRIELRNFGVLEVRERAARKARNPRTGDTVMVKKKVWSPSKRGRH
jgi:nucleoid DNA-binding protein